MKNVFMILLFFAPLRVGAQFGSYPGESLTNERRNLNVITKFSADYIAGKVMVSWTVINTDKNCIYQVERSENSSPYEVIGRVNGYSTIGNYETLYSFSDRNPLDKSSKYRVIIKDIDVSEDKIPLFGVK